MSPLDTRVPPPALDPDNTISSYSRIARAVAPPATLTRLVHERRLGKVLELIESEPSHSFRQLALEVHLNPAHLHRLFKHGTGANDGRLSCVPGVPTAAPLFFMRRLTN